MSPKGASRHIYHQELSEVYGAHKRFSFSAVLLLWLSGASALRLPALWHEPIAIVSCGCEEVQPVCLLRNAPCILIRYSAHRGRTASRAGSSTCC